MGRFELTRRSLILGAGGLVLAGPAAMAAPRRALRVTLIDAPTEIALAGSPSPVLVLSEALSLPLADAHRVLAPRALAALPDRQLAALLAGPAVRITALPARPGEARPSLGDTELFRRLGALLARGGLPDHLMLDRASFDGAFSEAGLAALCAGFGPSAPEIAVVWRRDGAIRGG
ncbi:hypothetical protein GCM10011390_07690 [Aureimonas endophytica]|uniref:Uncharacterized protein n=1 Tax=Aureimonas endophytica TaxID=2027858 RepID=A0A916ZE81_9HYPH|nr:hypothetical protein [Aureimonas endophytica]GGD91396.1 hypothetical protein GCM10011390_07690 [Aureimonas endophytica]